MNLKKPKNCNIKRIILAVIMVALVCTFVALAAVRQNVPVFSAEITNQFIKETPLISAHRAGRNLAPENTLLAFETCLAEAEDFRVDVFEFDLHMTADGQLVLLHDDTLDRTSNSREVFGKRNVKASECTLQELSRLNFGYNFQDESGNYPFRNYTEADLPDNLRIVTLSGVLQYLESQGRFNYIIEIKNSGKLGKQAADELVRILVEYNVASRAIIGTFHTGVSKYLSKNYPNITRSAGTGEVFAFYLIHYMWRHDLTDRNLGYKVLQIPDRMLFNFGTKELIEYAHSNGLAVQYWTINDAQSIERLTEYGADCIISDNPDIAYHTIYREAD